jgi:hypothetical protein
VLIIDAQEVTEVLSMRNCIEAMEDAFVQEARGIAVSHPRQRYNPSP